MVITAEIINILHLGSTFFNKMSWHLLLNLNTFLSLQGPLRDLSPAALPSHLLCFTKRLWERKALGAALVWCSQAALCLWTCYLSPPMAPTPPPSLLPRYLKRWSRCTVGMCTTKVAFPREEMALPDPECAPEASPAPHNTPLTVEKWFPAVSVNEDVAATGGSSPPMWAPEP